MGNEPRTTEARIGSDMKTVIKQALVESKPVLAEVLKDYPEYQEEQVVLQNLVGDQQYLLYSY